MKDELKEQKTGATGNLQSIDGDGKEPQGQSTQWASPLWEGRDGDGRKGRGTFPAQASESK